ncbi:MAG TPA: iron-containing alcohol dehydrogenase [Methylomirabilota bacterium]|nr:iron-containing alcohol dehydrogenase [Methylomirabilota bacterium]
MELAPIKMQSYELPTVIKHGVGALATLGEEAERLGLRRPLVVTDKGMRATGHVDRAAGFLEARGLEPAVFDGVAGNPSIHHVAAGTEAYRDHRADGVVALGGGSSMDVGKAIGVEVAHHGKILDYEYGHTPLGQRIPPLVCVPTTSGTGSEVTLWSVITDPARQIKFNVGGPLIGPHLALIDPLLVVGLPPHLTAFTGMDALSHAVECYTCAYAQPLTDAVALLAMEYIGQYLRIAYANGQDVEARYRMAMAAMLAGLAYGSESAGAVHAMAQTFGGVFDVHHGYLTGIMLAPCSEYNLLGNPEKYARIAQALGEDVRGLSTLEAARRGVAAIAALARDLEFPPFCEFTGARPSDIPRLSKMAEADPQTIGNPRIIDARGYAKIYARLMA